MDWNTGLTVAVSILLALGGYLATYANNLRLDRRRDRLARLDRQLAELYGPLLALVSTGNSAWAAFRSRHRPGGWYWSETDPPSAEDVAAWRLWMRIVFMPTNERIVEVVTQHADLLIESEMPQCLLDACAHVAAYRPVIEQWAGEGADDNTAAANTSTINFPSDELMQYVSSSFVRLKEAQSALLGDAAHGLEERRG